MMTEPTESRSFPGRRLALAGLGLAVAGVAVYAVRVSTHRLSTPWYLPATAALGAVLIAASLWQRCGVWRALAMGCVLLLALAECGFLLGTKLPTYAGPAAVGRPFPDFSTTRSDGSSFTLGDLVGRDTVLLFFRGRW